MQQKVCHYLKQVTTKNVSELFHEVHDVMVTYNKKTDLFNLGPSTSCMFPSDAHCLQTHTVKDFCFFSPVYLFLLHGPAKIGWRNGFSMYSQSAIWLDDDIRICDQLQPLFYFLYMIMSQLDKGVVEDTLFLCEIILVI